MDLQTVIMSLKRKSQTMITSLTRKKLSKHFRYDLELPVVASISIALVLLRSQLTFLSVAVMIYMAFTNVKQSAGPALKRNLKDEKPPQKSAPWKTIHAPTFKSESLVSQVDEFVRRIQPTAQGDMLVEKMAGIVRKLLVDLFPNGDVVGYSCCDVLQGTDFGLSNPEIDIVLVAPPKMLAERLHHRKENVENRTGWRILKASSIWKLKPLPLQKAVLRECMADLVVPDAFKFRRSAVGGIEPRVILVAPPSMTDLAVNVPVSFSVNSSTPFYTQALLAECGQIDARCRDLILLVRRWAKYRGISQADKGNLSPYLWTIFVIYFLQTNDVDGRSLLPPLGDFKLSVALLVNGDATTPPISKASRLALPMGGGQKESVAAMFHKFLSFYVSSFKWDSETVSLHTGKRTIGASVLPSERVVGIEDPFMPKQSLSLHMTLSAVERLRGEFRRAQEIVGRQGTVTELLEPWTAPQLMELASGAVAGMFDSPVSALS